MNTANSRTPIGGDANRNEPAVPTPERTESTAKRRVWERPEWLAILLLHLGPFGIPLYWRTGYSIRTRLLLIVASLAYSVLFVLVVYWGFHQIGRLIRELRS